jgi:predicted 3-demethylubiquinone-9 3-methyltransferase (glyoxalase superfamily)
MKVRHRIAPCLWFDDQAEEAALFYISIFPNSRVVTVTRYSDVGQEIHGRAPGSVMTVDFELDGQPFTALNGGPVFQFNEAVSFQVICANQKEVDRYWNQLTLGGDERAQQCGWLKDRFGVSWQVVPEGMAEMLEEPESEGARRAMEVMLQMKKLDIDELRRAFAGEPDVAADISV